MTIQIKVGKQSFPVAVFIMLYKLLLTFEYLDIMSIHGKLLSIFFFQWCCFVFLFFPRIDFFDNWCLKFVLWLFW